MFLKESLENINLKKKKIVKSTAIIKKIKTLEIETKI